MTTRPKPPKHISSRKQDHTISRPQATFSSIISRVSIGHKKDDYTPSARTSIMSPSASKRSSRANGQRSKRADSAVFSETEQSDEYQSSPVPKPSRKISQDDIKSFGEDIAPHLSELAEVRANISDSLGTVDNLLKKVTGKFKGRMDIVKGVEASWGKEQEQREEIERLNTLTRSLIGWKDREGKMLNDQIAALKEDLRVARLKVGEVEQEYEQKYATRQATLSAEEARLKANYENGKAELEAKEIDLKRKLKEENAKEVGELNKTIGNLNKTNKKLNDDNQKLKKEVLTLTSSLEKSERAYNSLGQETASIKSSMEKMQKEFKVAERPDEYFIQKLEEIQSEVGEISKNYFTELPESAVASAHTTSFLLKEKSQLFDMTPITDSSASVALRRANVQHLIMQSICDTIWQPLFCKALSNSSEARKFLGNISSALVIVGSRRESAWREMTLQGAENCSKTTEIHKDFLTRLVQEVLEKVQPLIEKSEASEIEEDMRDVFIKAIDLWTAAQKDGSRISAVTEPETDKNGWKEALADVLPEDPTDFQTSTPSRPRNCSPLFLFPKIVRICQPDLPRWSIDQAAEASNSPAPRVLYKGCALFADTQIFSIGADEKGDIEEAIKQASFRVGSTKRSPTTSTILKSPISRRA